MKNHKMLLRRITKHVREQNWFAVFIDFLIVVVGVFIGIQVANWNEGRQNQQLGDYYVKRLIVDLEKDLVRNKRVAQYYRAVLDSIVKADRLLSEPDSDPKEMLIAVYRASEYSDEPTNDATWRQIVSSGHLGLLPDAIIGGEMADYYKYSYYLNANRILESPYRATIRSIIPLPLQLKLRASCSDIYDQNGNAVKFRNDCDLDVSQTELEQAVKSLRASRLVKENLRNHLSRVGLVLNNREPATSIIERLLLILKSQE